MDLSRRNFLSGLCRTAAALAAAGQPIKSTSCCKI
ncbi:twin-arginine translocation signal domain-containing protein [Loktanella salsilacus]